MFGNFVDKKIFVKKGSTIPLIKYPITDWMLRAYDIKKDMLNNVAVTFSMVDTETNMYVIANNEAKIQYLTDQYDYVDEHRYNLIYNLKLEDTQKSGVYIGEFKLDFLDFECETKITLPLHNYLTIIIQDSITKTNLV